MITKYNKFNESIKSLLVGPSKEEVWKNLGYDKPFNTPEEFFLYMIDGMTIKEQTEYPNSIYYEKNGETILEKNLKDKRLWVEYRSIWKILENILGLNYGKTQSLIKNMVEEHLNWKGFRPLAKAAYDNVRWKNI